ncbi:hypothetical protein SH1V18_47140 [Vallitalea longa]|uniref:Uncharacterized protein n=2 Tax=Vallitalea longa TaxID=2936439 RepID=A0A9W5YFR6_9FIRM|nr:hypothetical protein SH1V18_47140 [Vallitalea longa]
MNKYMKNIYKKIRWMEYERIQKEKALSVYKLIKEKERKIKLKLFGSLSIITIIFITLLKFELNAVIIAGGLLSMSAVYYENIIEKEIRRRVTNENMY